jgi:hypothetical protein
MSGSRVRVCRIRRTGSRRIGKRVDLKVDLNSHLLMTRTRNRERAEDVAAIYQKLAQVANINDPFVSSQYRNKACYRVDHPIEDPVHTQPGQPR